MPGRPGADAGVDLACAFAWRSLSCHSDTHFHVAGCG